MTSLEERAKRRGAVPNTPPPQLRIPSVRRVVMAKGEDETRPAKPLGVKGGGGKSRSRSASRSRTRSRTPFKTGRSTSRRSQRSRSTTAEAAPAVPNSAMSKGKNKDTKGSRAKLPCYAFSRSNCTLGDKCPKEHRALTAEEIKKRDQKEEEFKREGKKSPWLGKRGNAKGRDKEKISDSKKGKTVKFDPNVPKKDVPCRFFRTANGCRLGDSCPFKHA